MARQPFDLLANLEADVLDPSVPLAQLLRMCLMLAGWAQAGEVRSWAQAELEGYVDRDAIPEYRVVAAPIMWDVVDQFGTVNRSVLNTQELPGTIREHINERVPLNQPVDQLEAMVVDAEARRGAAELSVFAGDIFMKVWNQNPRGQRVLRMSYWLHPTVIRGVLGQIRTALTVLVIELRSKVGQTDDVPSAEQANQALRSAVPMIVVGDNATVNMGDIVAEQTRTTIKDNTYKIRDTKGNVAPGSVGVTQTYTDTFDVAKLQEFAAFAVQIAPTLGLGADDQAELEAGAAELQAAAGEATPDRGGMRRAVDRMLGPLGRAGSSVAQKVAVSMGDEAIRGLGEEIVRHIH